MGIAAERHRDVAKRFARDPEVIFRVDASARGRVHWRQAPHAAKARGEVARPERSRHDVPSQRRHLMVSDRDSRQHLFGIRVRKGVRSDVVGVAVRLDTIPEHLKECDCELLGAEVRIVDLELIQELIEVDAAKQKQAIGLPHHTERTAFDVGAQRQEDRPHDPSLADPVVVSLVAVEVRPIRFVVGKLVLHHSHQK